MVSNDVLKAAVERWSQVIVDLGGSSEWTDGAIYPREMAFLLAHCELAQVETIIESGRAEGYSTMILGEYGRITGATVQSIDLETNAEVVERCKRRLARWKIDLVKGNAWEEVGRLVAAAKGRTALLIDGPKLWTAMSMLYAATGWSNVTLIASYNLGQHYFTGRFFRAAAGRPTTYEEMLGDFHATAWDSLKTQEELRNSETDARRTGWASTLNVLQINDENRERISNIRSPRFRSYQPGIVRWAWKNGRIDWVQTGAKLMHRALGPETDQR